MNKNLEEMVRIFQERKIVEKLAKADKQSRILVFDEEKQALSKELKEFRKSAKKKIELKEQLVNKDYNILPENAIDICLICMMTDINDNVMLGNYTELPSALGKVEGNFAYIAKNIRHSIGEDDGGKLFSDCEEEKLLKKFFYK